MTLAAVAKELDVHWQTIQRWETADVVVKKIQLRALGALYEVPNDTVAEWEGLRESAAKPGWWNGHGPRPDTTFDLLGMEAGAVRFRSYDLTAIPGLLQTPEVARLTIQAVDPNISPTQLDDDVSLRMGRQNKVFDGPVREMVFIIDELAFARLPGPASVRRAQIARLLTPPARADIQVVPFAAGMHPALGSFMIFDFKSKVIPTGVYIGGSLRTKGLVETGREVERFEQLWTWMQAKGLSPSDTRTFLHEKLERITDE